MNLSLENNIYMIGDTKLDLIAAQEAGVQGVGVLCGYGNKSELNKYTNLIYSDALKSVKEIQNLEKRLD